MILGCIDEFLGAACMVLDDMRGCKPYKDLTLLDTLIAYQDQKLADVIG